MYYTTRTVERSIRFTIMNKFLLKLYVIMIITTKIIEYSVYVLGLMI